MTDTFNLVPGTNEEKLLDNILRTAQGEQPQYKLAPNWRIEQYLDAIQKALSGGGGLPPVTASDAGKVLAVDNSGVWGAENLYGYGRRIQIEATYSNGEYSTDTQITPSELMEAITAGYDFQLFVGTDIATMHLLVTDDEYAVFKATLKDKSNVAVVMNGFDHEYLTITISPYDNRFIVTLTPTAADYSGTMDKTVAEINAAYEAGQEIVFRVITGATTYMEVDCTARYYDGTTYPSFSGYIVSDDGMLINAFTSATDNGTRNDYDTSIYALTPAT